MEQKLDSLTSAVAVMQEVLLKKDSSLSGQSKVNAKSDLNEVQCQTPP